MAEIIPSIANNMEKSQAYKEQLSRYKMQSGMVSILKEYLFYMPCLRTAYRHFFITQE